MGAITAVISGPISMGQVWALDKVGRNETLVLTGTVNPYFVGTMQLTATRQVGILVVRNDNNLVEHGDVFCLDTGVEFSLYYPGNAGRCPANETDVLLADDLNINTTDGAWHINDWDKTSLVKDIKELCTYTGGCQGNWWFNWNGYGIGGGDMTGFESTPLSNSNSQIDMGI